MKIRFKKLSRNAVTPSYAKPGDAGMDMTSVTHLTDTANQTVNYHTGIAVEIPKGYVGLLFPRSSVYKTDLILSNCVGVIDSGYRGEIVFKYKMPPNTYYPSLKRFDDGDRVGQLIIIPYPEIEMEEVTELTDSERGEQGFGSTGK
jgi:dUTP pyrophosphatase